jgi:hypothetical protein
MARTREPPAPASQLLEKVIAAVRRRRDTAMEIEGLEAQLKLKQEALSELEREELPDLFTQAHMREYVLEAEGNMPPYRAKLGPYYKASISAKWEPERRQAAFDWVASPDEGKGNAPDLIKTIITIELGRGEKKLAERVMAGLVKAGVQFDVAQDIPWNTLTAFVKECVEERKIMPPLDVLGAIVGRIVKVKPEKSNGSK